MYFLKRKIRERPQPNPTDIADWQGSELLNRLVWSRGVRSPQELDNSLSLLPHFRELDGAVDAGGIIAEHVIAGNKICVCGDYDADGATSTALVVDFLRQIGAQRVDFVIPDRFVDGYGLKKPMAERIFISGFNLVITVDNGVSSIEAVEYLRSEGVDVVITDHHLVGDEIPRARAIVNPSMNKNAFAAPNLAGVGVAFYTMLAVRSSLEAKGYFQGREKPNMNQWLDLVAVGTIADVVPLDRVNRMLISHGLKRMRANRARTGIKSIIKACGRTSAWLNAQDIAFSVGPTLNAVGRLDDMRSGVLCLLESNAQRADEMAKELRQINEDRKTVELGMVREGLKHIKDSEQAAIVLYEKDWHEGVVGLVASRIKERFFKPCIAFTRADEAGVLKGSGRSIPGIHIRDMLAEVERRVGGLFLSYGGHAAAAGMSLYERDLPEFRSQIERVASEFRQSNTSDPLEIWVDGALDLRQFNLAQCVELECAIPWGQQFCEPRFQQQFWVTSVRPLGGEEGAHLALTLKVDDNPVVYNAVLFGFKDKTLPQAPPADSLIGQCIKAVYRPSVNRWRGREQIQLMLDYFEVVATAP